MKINEKNLCVFATSPPYDCEGFLTKRGEVNKAFQRRYFVLKGNLLFYFERKGDKEPLGLIIVEGCTIELSEESDQYCFEIAFNGNRTYILCADSQESMETWMKALTCAGYEYKKLMVAELQRQLEEIEGSRNKICGDTSSKAATSSFTDAASAPKPPPRRTNPFNRPAPPLPGASNGHGSSGGGGIVCSQVPFINGHFAVVTTATTPQQRAAGPGYAIAAERSPKPPKPPRSMGGGRSEFYTHEPQTSAKTTVFAPASSVSAAAALASLAMAANFEQLHEKFRHMVMKDILNYQMQRELKSQPLIQL